MNRFNPYQKTMFILALSSLIMMIAWIYIGAPYLTNTVDDFNFYNSYSGELKTFDLENSKVKDSFEINRKITNKAEKASKKAATIKMVDTFTNTLSQEVLMQNERSFNIDTEKRNYYDENGEKKFLFPQNTQKLDYEDVFYQVYPYLTVSKFTFANEENVLGMFSYVFRYKLESISIDKKMIITKDATLGDKKVLGNFEGKIWVEPRTGFIIKQESYWNFFFNNDDGQNQTIESGRIWQQDEETKRVISLIESKKAMAQIYEMWVPLYLLIFALAFGIGVLLKESGR